MNLFRFLFISLVKCVWLVLFVCVCLICLSLKSLFRVHFVGLFFWVLVPLALQRRLFTVMGGGKKSTTVSQEDSTSSTSSYKV